jgi:hypothetical protein
MISFGGQCRSESVDPFCEIDRPLINLQVFKQEAHKIPPFDFTYDGNQNKAMVAQARIIVGQRNFRACGRAARQGIRRRCNPLEF